MASRYVYAVVRSHYGELDTTVHGGARKALRVYLDLCAKHVDLAHYCTSIWGQEVEFAKRLKRGDGMARKLTNLSLEVRRQEVL